MARLNDDLADIHSIMKQNIEEVLNRGEKLDRELWKMMMLMLMPMPNLLLPLFSGRLRLSS